MSRLESVDTHFAFGENWKSFLSTVDAAEIDRSDEGMRSLFPGCALVGKTFLDIGCGSGLPALSAIRLGAAHVTCIDIDRHSVEAATSLLTRMTSSEKWSAAIKSVFQLSPTEDGLFDVVHSWGVLHHTGNMWRAVDCASALVKPGGMLCIALYEKTMLCPAWKIEKRIYSRGSRRLQGVIRTLFIALNRFGARLAGNDYDEMRRRYTEENRGMDWEHDLHDWLGGYPYESASMAEVEDHLRRLGFRVLHRTGLGRTRHGLWGSGCAEYVAIRE